MRIQLDQDLHSGCTGLAHRWKCSIWQPETSVRKNALCDVLSTCSGCMAGAHSSQNICGAIIQILALCEGRQNSPRKIMPSI